MQGKQKQMPENQIENENIPNVYPFVKLPWIQILLRNRREESDRLESLSRATSVPALPEKVDDYLFYAALRKKLVQPWCPESEVPPSPVMEDEEDEEDSEDESEEEEERIPVEWDPDFE